jgi:hypothetical protein
MLQTTTVRMVFGTLVGLLFGASGLSVPGCLESAPRSLCVKHDRSCAGPSMCATAEECVPAEAFDADAATDCDGGRCVWDCSDGESCPDGWSCEAEETELVDLVGGC